MEVAWPILPKNRCRFNHGGEVNRSLTVRTVLVSMSLPLWVACASAQQPAGTSATNGGGGPQSTVSPAGRSLADGVYTAQQASAGEQVFRQVCTACHSASEFSGPAFAGRWAGRTVGDLFQLVQGTMPQDNPGGRTPQEYAAIISYFLRLNEHPAGQAELPSEVLPLRSIRFGQ
jgi:mono/diheme cytochrome c family protein